MPNKLSKSQDLQEASASLHRPCEVGICTPWGSGTLLSSTALRTVAAETQPYRVVNGTVPFSFPTELLKSSSVPGLVPWLCDRYYVLFKKIVALIYMTSEYKVLL